MKVKGPSIPAWATMLGGSPGEDCSRSEGSKRRKGCLFDNDKKVLANHSGNLRREIEAWETWWVKIEQGLIKSLKMDQCLPEHCHSDVEHR